MPQDGSADTSLRWPCLHLAEGEWAFAAVNVISRSSATAYFLFKRGQLIT